MIQIYFLSVFLNILAGLILLSGEGKGGPTVNVSFSFLNDETLKLVAGILSIAIGVLKILSPAEGNIIILGDLFPAAAGLASGLILCFDFNQKRSTIIADEEKTSIIPLLVKNKRIAGFAALCAAVLHFLFPKVFLL